MKSILISVLKASVYYSMQYLTNKSEWNGSRSFAHIGACYFYVNIFETLWKKCFKVDTKQIIKRDFYALERVTKLYSGRIPNTVIKRNPFSRLFLTEFSCFSRLSLNALPDNR